MLQSPGVCPGFFISGGESRAAKFFLTDLYYTEYRNYGMCSKYVYNFWKKTVVEV
jgi:hypothetical protein